MNLYSAIRSAVLSHYNGDAEKAGAAVFDKLSLAAEYAPLAAGISRLVLSPNGHNKKSFSEIFPEYEGPDFHNILSVPAGFDKYCNLSPLTYSLGFGWHVFGSIFLNEWHGNNIAPRIVSLGEFSAGWNRMGLNNIGAMKAKEKLKRRNPDYVLFASIVQTPSCKTIDNGIKDICSTIGILYSSADGFEINLSCPNTEDAKTFETPESLDMLLHGISKTIDGIFGFYSRYDKDVYNLYGFRKKPILLKLSPNLSPELYSQLAGVGSYYNVSGYVLSNTLPARQWVDSLEGAEKERAMAALKNIGSAAWNEGLQGFEGGISGKPLEKHADEAIAAVEPLLSESQIIVGVGNFSPENIRQRMDKFPKIKLVQSYTRFLQDANPFFVREMLNSRLISGG